VYKKPEDSTGEKVASLLQGAWREVPPAISSSKEELQSIRSAIQGSGAGGLGWWRLRHSRLRESLVAEEFRHSFRVQALHEALYKSELQIVFRRLQEANISPILIKGWSIARRYATAGLRPCGDIDLLVPPEQLAKAQQVLAGLRSLTCAVDLKHYEVTHLTVESFAELFAHSESIKLDEAEIRILRPEDLLRFLCIHFLRHSAYRPLWLCDIAVAIESRPPDFDWDICFRNNKRYANWIGCCIGLGHHLLGVRVDDIPLAYRVQRVPKWLIKDVLKHWNLPCPADRNAMPEFILKSLKTPGRLSQALRDRWPDPIWATMRWKGTLNNLPRLPYQVATFLWYGARFFKRLPDIFAGTDHAVRKPAQNGSKIAKPS
jgi:hypothetical protein